MRKRLVSLLFAGIMACSVIGSGVTTFAAENDSHINLALFTYIEGMDPATDWCGWNLTRCGVGETLVTVNENMEIVGQLADEWEQVDDTTYRFHIRQGVKFSNGTELTPEIVKDSIQRSIDNNSRGGDLKIANIEVDGENVVFTTDGAYSAFVSQLTEPMTVIVDTTADTSNYDTMPICTGPYAVSEYVSEEKIELVANENYWDGAPEIKSITVKNIGSDTKVDAMLSGDIDLAQGPDATALNRVENNDDINIVKVTGTRENDFELNCHEGNPLSDKNLRLALSYAVDRDVVAQVAGNGYSSPISTAFPPSVGYDSEDVNGQVYDLDKAKEYLAKAFPNGNAALDISVGADRKTIAEMIQSQCKEIGLTINIVELDSAGISTTTTNGEHQSCLYGMGFNIFGDDARRILQPGSAVNKAHYDSPEVMELLDKAVAEEDEAKRLDYYKQIQENVYEHVPYIPIYYADGFIGVKKGTGGIDIYPTSHHDFSNIFVPAE